MANRVRPNKAALHVGYRYMCNPLLVRAPIQKGRHPAADAPLPARIREPRYVGPTAGVLGVHEIGRFRSPELG
jgi:hypothetical protein